MTTVNGTSDPSIARVEHRGYVAYVPSDLCLADHSEGKTTWQRLAEILDTDLEDGGRVLWSQADRRPRDRAYDSPWWELTGYLTLTSWGLGFEVDRDYDGELTRSAGLNVGPWSLWLSRHRAVTS